jgi:hypothetical protein
MSCSSSPWPTQEGGRFLLSTPVWPTLNNQRLIRFQGH